tara:strand:+ start:942 stop:1361 length:420 start_codon:yes stop_codon:yes gene_type:complete
MALVSTNAWKSSIEETIQSALRNEFKSSLPVFRSKINQIRGNQFVVIRGNSSNPNQTMFAKLSSTYNLNIDFFMIDRKRNDNTIKKFFKIVSRLEETLYSLLEIDPTFKIQVDGISYEDDNEFEGYRKAVFEISLRSVR